MGIKCIFEYIDKSGYHRCSYNSLLCEWIIRKCPIAYNFLVKNIHNYLDASVMFDNLDYKLKILLWLGQQKFIFGWK